MQKKLFFQVPAEHKSKIEEIVQKQAIRTCIKHGSSFSSTRKYVSGQHHVFQNDTNTEIKGIVPKRLQTQETLRRYDNIDQIIDKVRSKRTMLKDLLTEKLDRLMVHKFWGYVLFPGCSFDYFPECILSCGISKRMD